MIPVERQQYASFSYGSQQDSIIRQARWFEYDGGDIVPGRLKGLDTP